MNMSKIIVLHTSLICLNIITCTLMPMEYGYHTMLFGNEALDEEGELGESSNDIRTIKIDHDIDIITLKNVSDDIQNFVKTLDKTTQTEFLQFYTGTYGKSNLDGKNFLSLRQAELYAIMEHQVFPTLLRIDKEPEETFKTCFTSFFKLKQKKEFQDIITSINYYQQNKTPKNNTMKHMQSVITYEL